MLQNEIWIASRDASLRQLPPAFQSGSPRSKPPEIKEIKIMAPPIPHSKTTTLPIKNPINRSPFQRAYILVAFMLGCLALAPAAQAVLPPPAPDGGYPGANTAEGDGALFSLTTGQNNTAVGADALNSNTTGFWNTANGVNALASNRTGSYNTA